MYPIEGAVIACAGLGSRLGMGLPKCMIEVGGQTILSQLISLLRPWVTRIHVVVGYREELIIDYCSRHHPEVVIVRNGEFRSTNTAHSLMLGSIGFSRKVLYLDGDLLIDRESFEGFLEHAAGCELTLGITQAKSSEAVYVSTGTDSDSGSLEVRGFHRDMPTEYEWANFFVASPALLGPGSKYVFECLAPFLPAATHPVEVFEVDTPEDLDRAKAWVNSQAIKN